MRVGRLSLVGGIVVSCVFGLLQLLGGSAAATSGGATQRVIVVFRDQDAAQPADAQSLGAREASFQSSRSAVVGQMDASGASNVHAYKLINAVSATVSATEVADLRSDPAVREVVPDEVIQLPNMSQPAASSSGAVTPLPGSCSKPGTVQLDPQALETIGAASSVKGARTARSLGLTGAGVKVAFIADGLDTNDPDFIRPDGQHVFVDYKDFSGDGTSSPTDGGEAFLDASSIAAQGRETYNISDYTARPLDRPCDIRIEGVAPGASLVGLDVFGSNDGAYDSTILQAIDYAVTVDHVNVLNESLGTNLYPDEQADLDLTKAANDAAVAAGTVVTVSSGDAGPTNTIGTPATDPHVIDAGASTTFRSYAQSGSGGLGLLPGIKGWLNDNLSALSGGGFQQDGQTVDLLAPGDLNWALCSTDNTMYADCTNDNGQGTPVELTGGTSEAAPLTAGAAALVIQGYRETHHGHTPSPNLVKRLIVSNTDDVGIPSDEQGTGRLDAYKAGLAAETYKRKDGPKRRASIATVLDSKTQLNVVAAPRTHETLHDTLTNASRRTETLYLRTRAVGTYHEIAHGSVTLSDSTSAQFTDQYGVQNNLERFRFNVPAHEKRLNFSVSFAAPAGTAFYQVPQVSLVDPKGRLAANDVPQGDANFGDSQVTDPTPGRWTALIYAFNSSYGGYVGNVLAKASVARYASFGRVTPSRVTLAPGRSTRVTVRTAVPAVPGDSAGAVVVSTHKGANGSDDAGNAAGPVDVTTIPITLRGVIRAGASAFTAITTGGNGRTPYTGQTFYYKINVPKHSRELNQTVTLLGSANNPFQAWLVGPNGESQAYATNVYLANAFSNSPGPATTLPGAALHVLAPARGRWTLVLVFAPVASGTAFSDVFRVRTNERALKAKSGGLPDSYSTQLSAGSGRTYNVRIDNTSTATEFFFPDARRSGSTMLSLGSVNGASTSVPLNNSSSIPTYLVPTDSTEYDATASTSGSEPFGFDSSPAAFDDAELGDPALISSTGTSVLASLSAKPLTQGPWDIAPNIHGAFGSTGAAQEPVTTSLSVRTRPFDPTVSSSTGDLEADSVDPGSTLSNFAPVLIPPGQMGTIPVTITPSGGAGTHDKGTLYIDEYYDTAFASFIDPIGDQVVAIPYRYTIK